MFSMSVGDIKACNLSSMFDEDLSQEARVLSLEPTQIGERAVVTSTEAVELGMRARLPHNHPRVASQRK